MRSGVKAKEKTNQGSGGKPLFLGIAFVFLALSNACTPTILGERPSAKRAREAAELRSNSTAKNLSWQESS
ncbi:MAG: hypothetical protein KGP28_11800, partial [Bdellovibrionales bacterium]|nr:hypothetical protein [Bdellovibrionales bacterium]